MHINYTAQIGATPREDAANEESRGGAGGGISVTTTTTTRIDDCTTRHKNKSSWRRAIYTYTETIHHSRPGGLNLITFACFELVGKYFERERES